MTHYSSQGGSRGALTSRARSRGRERGGGRYLEHVAAEDVPAAYAGVLREARFRITCEETPDATPAPVALLSGLPKLRIDSDFTRVADGDDTAQAALDWLVAYLDDHTSTTPRRTPAT